jgi:hypothetical protein
LVRPSGQLFFHAAGAVEDQREVLDVVQPHALLLERVDQRGRRARLGVLGPLVGIEGEDGGAALLQDGGRVGLGAHQAEQVVESAHVGECGGGRQQQGQGQQEAGTSERN